ncbi:uncharacterized protein MELLADRAFT_94687 [Melampsora larici-populina 98AG31]|uniref:Uncharacterized protein n=1 Tax=Melampsora larici-populina (strain 98AG31 / pathotype 3-4-7) TaxID=747676 RepID=F4S7L0_MELLP|nr:uncharacterized protein MELLADRAFT_94687 [Melampsora larici-populina 98AG31]EGF99337.1 hypothetical protein MELLADRAFT_94687 [Melampsora larici-populina 98AG31]
MSCSMDSQLAYNCNTGQFVLLLLVNQGESSLTVDLREAYVDPSHNQDAQRYTNEAIWRHGTYSHQCHHDTIPSASRSIGFLDWVYLGQVLECVHQMQLRGITNGQGIAANYYADIVPVIVKD